MTTGRIVSSERGSIKYLMIKLMDENEVGR